MIRNPFLSSLAFAALAATGSVPTAHAALANPLVPDAPGTYVWVEGHRMHIHCEGSGSPTVIFDSGLGGTSLDWSLIQPEVARHTRACTYDRAGYGWSDRGPSPRHSQRIVHELESLLGYSSVSGPYLLVGHSFGGLNVQLFAKRNPHRVAGMVLVDSSHERQFDEFDRAGLPSLAPRGQMFMLRNYNNVPSNMPAEVRPLAELFAYASDTTVSIHSELANMRRSAHQLGATDAPFPDVPVAVVVHDPAPYLASPRSSQMASLWWELQGELASRTSHSRLIVAETPDHYVQFGDPETVTSAILEVLKEARRPDTSVLASAPGSCLRGEPEAAVGC